MGDFEGEKGFGDGFFLAAFSMEEVPITGGGGDGLETNITRVEKKISHGSIIQGIEELDIIAHYGMASVIFGTNSIRSRFYLRVSGRKFVSAKEWAKRPSFLIQFSTASPSIHEHIPTRCRIRRGWTLVVRRLSIENAFCGHFLSHFLDDPPRLEQPCRKLWYDRPGRR
jgi:hypothetical protein